jgi:glucans biosynthesis protein C
MNITNRRLDLDWIRIAAFALLIAYHVGMYYVTWDWHIKSPFASEAIEPLMLTTNPWRLSLLFFVSGCATAFLLRATPRSGLGRVARQRSRFLLVPLVFGILVVVPPQSWLEVGDKLGYTGSYLDFWQRYLSADHSFCRDGHCLVLPTWNHLWFVVYLWVYTLLLIGLRAMKLSADWARRWLTGWRLLVLPWLVLWFARAIIYPRFGSTYALLDDPYNHAQYFTVFAVGYLLAFEQGAWDWMVAKRWPHLALAVAAYASIFLVPMRMGYALMQWSAILAALGWARHLLANAPDTPVRRYLSDAVFCYYIVHQTAIILVAHALRPLALAPAVEGPLLILATLGACATAYELARRIAPLRPLLGIRAARISRRSDDVSRHSAGVSS